MTAAVQRRILYGILAAYTLIAILYSLITPIMETSDELWHYPMVKYLADHGLQLPPQDPANPGPWRQEGSQPPLYYMISALLTAGIDTSDMEGVRRQNPHADIGIVRPDGNANMLVHRTEAEAFPWHGTALAIHVIRFFSIALGLGTVLVTYQLARDVFPGQPVLALGAAALNAFLPMFVFISASVNNDNLSNFASNLLILLLVRLIKSPRESLFDWRPFLWIGITVGVALLSKLSAGFLIPLTGVVLLIVSLRQRDWRPLLVGGAICTAVSLVMAGWWYARNQTLYGDPTGLSMFLQMVGRRAIPANAAQLWSERHSFTQAYWGFFGGVNVPLPEGIYLIFNIIGGIALLSAVTLIAQALISRKWSLDQWLPTSIIILWPLMSFASYLRWTAETPASQGRLIFGALSAISVWMAVGLGGWLPKRLQGLALSGAVVYFFAVAGLAPLLVIAPAYRLPNIVSPTQPKYIFRETNGSGQIGLSDVRILTPQVQPEDYVQIELDWQILQPTSQDWSLFVHLASPDGVIVGQRDIYPGQGKLATSDLPTGRAWVNPVAVWIPPAAYAPMALSVEVGWYHLKTGERLRLSDGAETISLGQVELLPRQDSLNLPNPLRVNFDNQIELMGYALSDLSPKAGDALELTLYWRAVQKVERDYVVFVHILEPHTQTIYAASDAMPAQWTAPTSTWEVGSIIEDKHILTVKPESPPGIYELEIGFYLQEAGGSFPRLPVVTSDGGMADNFFYLSRVRILPVEQS